jgi:hypothetical protein
MSSSSSSRSGSSVSDPMNLSDSPNRQANQQAACHWRTQPDDPASCSRYWDCPGHTRERTLTHSAQREPGQGIINPILSRADVDTSGSGWPWPQASGSSAESPGGNGLRLRSRASGSNTQTYGTASNPIVLGDSPPQPRNRPSFQPGSASSDSTDSIHINRSLRAPPAYLAATTLGAPASNLGRPSRASQHQSPFAPMSRNTGMAASPSLTLPRWQPDEEVTYCPICHTQFSFMNRKHHCRLVSPFMSLYSFSCFMVLTDFRKCGRVVCSACSPHRITIPHQYIVRQPGAPRVYPTGSVSSYGEGGFADFSSIGGGERVRLCNPCVPDPNISPPQTQGPVPGGHTRSQSSISQPAAATTSPTSNRWSSYLGAGPSSDAVTRSRSITVVRLYRFWISP